MNTTANPTTETTQEIANEPPKTTQITIPLLPTAATAVLLGGLFFGVLSSSVFPVFRPGEELLIPFPPDEIAQQREAVYRNGRFLNPLLGLGSLALVSALAIPLVLQGLGKTRRGALKMVVPMAAVACLLTAVGLGLGHLVMELPATESLGIGRTFLARWLVFGFFGAAVGAAVGFSLGGKPVSMKMAINAATVGVICALVLDLIYVPIATSQVDVLVPGGITWGSKNALSLGLYTLAIVCTITLGLTRQLERTRT